MPKHFLAKRLLFSTIATFLFGAALGLCLTSQGDESRYKVSAQVGLLTTLGFCFGTMWMPLKSYESPADSHEPLDLPEGGDS